MTHEKLVLSALDYLIFAATLAVSAGIGLFFQMTSKKKTNEEYLLAGKDMSVLPVAFSLMATFMSATVLMGIPAEMYLYGTNMTFMNVGFALGPIISAYVFLPIFFANDVSTAYEYLEKRFGRTTRRLISGLFAFQLILFTAATLYAPALALSAVTNLSLWMSVIVIGVVCTFYCTLGGMKAVLWADVFQAVLMFATLFTVVIKGCLLLGGIGKVFEIANEGGRLILPKFSFDLEAHYTMFNVCIQGIIVTISAYGGSQIQVQRLMTLKNLNKSKLKIIVYSRASFLSAPMVGALLGILVSMTLAACLSFIPENRTHKFLPLSNECPTSNSTELNFTSTVSNYQYSTTSIYADSTLSSISEPDVEEKSFYLSYMWISSLSLITCLVVGYLGSLIFSCLKGKTQEVPEIYLSPVRLWFSKKKSDEAKQTKENGTNNEIIHEVHKEQKDASVVNIIDTESKCETKL
ncbi:putative sodium-dependent multivitamin transporter [Nephila pilipes]|uniref:Putative sodium-dependent multivitamin transporter n=1 Tax=Nephila pilipes TaxID=299642 RepID=A0A8X6UJT7_NEPPI|nr:putative sodium-dependent multivitamin transporter [Nephila pilipes]